MPLTPEEHWGICTHQAIPQKIDVVVDPVANLLDELVDLSEVWKKQRSKGFTPNATRMAMINVACEIALIEGEKL